MELDVIAAVFVGGASAMGGVGEVAGAVIGAFIMGVMNNGMGIMGINIDWQQVIKGLVLLGAVVFDRLQQEEGLSRQEDRRRNRLVRRAPSTKVELRTAAIGI